MGVIWRIFGVQEGTLNTLDSVFAYFTTLGDMKFLQRLLLSDIIKVEAVFVCKLYLKLR
jgi:hypothetical protein